MLQSNKYLVLLLIFGNLCMANVGKIILVNGIQASGKSTICSLLQNKLTETHIYLPLDKYLELMPKRLVNFDAKTINTEPDGITVKCEGQGNEQICKLQVGPKAMNFAQHYPDIVKLFANLGHNIIIDGVYYGPWLKWIAQQFNDYQVLFVKIDCPLDVALKREKDRGSFVGLVRGIYNEFEENKNYDFVIDSSKFSADNCAEDIKKFIESNPTAKALKLIRDSSG